MLRRWPMELNIGCKMDGLAPALTEQGAFPIERPESANGTAFGFSTGVEKGNQNVKLSPGSI